MSRTEAWYEARRARDLAAVTIAMDVEYIFNLPGLEITAEPQYALDEHVRHIRHALADLRAAHRVMQDETAGAS